ncbi:MAG: ethanolamine ammonia-lyase subunit EutC [Pirellulales bacterium]|nr:ethanolamine ammonia-lyase subunit EutC [Pirellulales bacterium]
MSDDAQFPATTARSEAAMPADLQRVLARTPARLIVGRAGPSYKTGTLLKLREDHAAARDAVYTEFDLNRDFPTELVRKYGLFQVESWVRTKAEYLMRPDLGRKFSGEAAEKIRQQSAAQPDLQIVIGDGLSATAVRVQIPQLLPQLLVAAADRGWRVGQTFVVRYCRVGILNDVGDLLRPTVAVLLIGERPGLATAESLSAYMAYRPQAGHTDAQRNLISNIHSRGVGNDEAAGRIISLAAQMMRLKASGVSVKEETSCGLLRDG